jgi:hypothetical protein
VFLLWQDEDHVPADRLTPQASRPARYLDDEVKVLAHRVEGDAVPFVCDITPASMSSMFASSLLTKNADAAPVAPSSRQLVLVEDVANRRSPIEVLV